MDRDDITKKLQSLLHLDFDAVKSYEEAIDEIEVDSIKDQVEQFREDHMRHVSHLSQAIRDYGGQPEEKRDIMGYFIEGFTRITGWTGTKGALQGLRSAEKITNNKYEDAVKWDLPENLKDLINRHYDDERRHLAYIERVLSESDKWEKQTARRDY